MYLKSVTLKGFKSFAAPTTFALEPGVTAIVGPNGSGKSNVVDALAWVMGEQAVKTLRGGKMEDVIFAGTSTRGPLGRAEVQLTIDNADGALPIEYAEVSISRTLFRNGSSEYAINGESCRLLDVQELLSDSGLGREMHVIVGQGRLDSVLHASAEDRRGFIEEAAGILKHRRRKEKTLRKLDAMQANVTRLSDLAGELRRQLKPLGKQAEIAREAAGIAAVVRDAKARLFADDLVTLRSQLAEYARTEHERHTERGLLQEQAEDIRSRIAQFEQRQRVDGVDQARRVLHDLERVHDRLRSLDALARQRVSFLDEPTDVDDLAQITVSVQMIETARADIDELSAGLGEAQDAAAEASKNVTAARAELDALDVDIAEQSALVSSHEMKLNTLRGSADAADAALHAVRDAVKRQQAALAAAAGRRDEAQAKLAEVVEEGGGDQATDHAEAYERAQQESTQIEAEVTLLRDELHAAEREAEALAAQVAALTRALDVRSAAAELVARDARGVLGLVGDAVKVTPGFEVPIAAALDSLADGVLVGTADDAADIARLVRDDDLGVVHMTIAEAAPAPDTIDAVAGAVVATDHVSGPPGVTALLARVLIADDIAHAGRILAALTGASDYGAARVVTSAGEVITAYTVRAGSGQSRSRLELTAERDAAAERAGTIRAQVATLSESLTEAKTRWERARAHTAGTLADLRDYDAALAAYAERANRATVTYEAAVAECERLEAGLGQAEQTVAEAERAAAAATDRYQQAQNAPRPILDASARDGLLAAVEAARESDMTARLDVETARERIRAAHSRLTQLESQRERERKAAEDAARRRVLRRAQRDVAASVAAEIPAVVSAAMASVATAREELAAAEAARAETGSQLARLRAQEGALRERLAGLTESVHGLELQTHEKRLHLASLTERIRSELSLDEDILISEYGPDQPVPGDLLDESEPAQPDESAGVPFDRGQQQRRLHRAERQLGQLGRVNPLALEEFAALEQRHTFLTEQLTDLAHTRDNLFTIISDLDDRMQSIFLDAFHDTQQAFKEVFPILFPGGTGSITLTDPDNPLTTGIEVSVRPAGKKIERLSLLSGGERSLAAVAFLVAIFTARPSPFYILDEVEAALDDANLGRLLGVFHRLRDSSQLIVITHQKRTMEIADALYGVSMRQDGVSAVVGQRMARPDSE